MDDSYFLVNLRLLLCLSWYLLDGPSFILHGWAGVSGGRNGGGRQVGSQSQRREEDEGRGWWGNVGDRSGRPLLLVAGRATLELPPPPTKWNLHFLFFKYQLLVCNISMPLMASVWCGRSTTKKKKKRVRKEVESHWSFDAIMHVS